MGHLGPAPVQLLALSKLIHESKSDLRWWGQDSAYATAPYPLFPGSRHLPNPFSPSHQLTCTGRHSASSFAQRWPLTTATKLMHWYHCICDSHRNSWNLAIRIDKSQDPNDSHPKVLKELRINMVALLTKVRCNMTSEKCHLFWKLLLPVPKSFPHSDFDPQGRVIANRYLEVSMLKCYLLQKCPFPLFFPSKNCLSSMLNISRYNLVFNRLRATELLISK